MRHAIIIIIALAAGLARRKAMIVNVRRCDAKRRLINGGFWHNWFAWHPVKVGHEWVWLETVMRRRVWWFCIAGCGYDSFYRKLPNGSGEGRQPARKGL